MKVSDKVALIAEEEKNVDSFVTRKVDKVSEI